MILRPSAAICIDFSQGYIYWQRRPIGDNRFRVGRAKSVERKIREKEGREVGLVVRVKVNVNKVAILIGGDDINKDERASLVWGFQRRFGALELCIIGTRVFKRF